MGAMQALELGTLGTAGNVLVVDDEAPVRKMLGKVLRREGYRVFEAQGGEEAIHLLDAHAIDVVLLDVFMPHMTGLEVCRRIRADPRTARTPVVFLSAADDRPSRREAREAGADDFLSKPLDESELRARVRTSVWRKRHSDHQERDRLALRAELDQQMQELQKATLKLERARTELEHARHETLERLSRAAQFRDDETATHLLRMSHYCRLLAQRKHLPADVCDLIQVASPMHDIGKIGIPDSILRKPGPLHEGELAIMRQHAEIGYRILSGSNAELLQLAASIARSHHEKWNGEGYPLGLRAEDIPIEGRIAAVADVFDALTSVRPYKVAWSLADAIAVLQTGRGQHFDPELVDLFLGAMDEVLEIKARFVDERTFQ